MKVIIERDKLIEYFFRDQSWLDNFEYLEDEMKEKLKKGCMVINMLTICRLVSDIPSGIIVNKKDIPERKKMNKYKGGFDISYNPKDDYQFSYFPKKVKKPSTNQLLS